MNDDKTEQKKSKVTLDNKSDKYKVKTKKASKTDVPSEVEIGSKAVKDARSKTGAYKARNWTSKLHYNDSGAAYARTDKNTDGKNVTKATTPKESRDMEKKYKYDKKIFKRDSTSHAGARKRTAAGIKKGSK
jgi:hypothetical protein